MQKIKEIQQRLRRSKKSAGGYWFPIPAHMKPRNSDFEYLEFKIDNIVYTKPSNEFTLAVEKVLIWHKLSEKG